MNMWSLADAIIHEDISQVRDMLYSRINVNEIDEYGFTPLIEAAIADNEHIARMLIEAGADVNLQDMTGRTPLHWAVENNNIPLSELLLLHGANPNAYNFSGQPILATPLLRRQQELKKLLIRAGANLSFAQDFINTKFLGHLFELVGTADIVAPDNEFVEVDFEGFYLEVTLAMIAESFAQFKDHFAGRQIRQYENISSQVINGFFNAVEIIKYQQYRIDILKYRSRIHSLLAQEPVIIPIGYEGHAITFIKFDTILVKCDRREDSRLYDNIVFYRITQPHIMSIDFMESLIFEKQTSEYINEELPKILGLEFVTELKVSAQVSGNCSWANVEACIPVLFFLFFSGLNNFQENIPGYKTISLNLLNQWREWSKDRALNFCIQSFYESDSIQKACKAEILAAILFQACQGRTLKDKERTNTILSVFRNSSFLYVLQNYVKSYSYEDQSEEGKYFLDLMKAEGVVS